MPERLEPRLLLDVGPLLISEFMARNGTTFPDGDGDYSDWIEIHNPADMEASLAGWYLTDDPADLTQWQFPAISLAADEYLIVFASGRNESDYDECRRQHVRLRVMPVRYQGRRTRLLADGDLEAIEKV